MGWLVQWYVGYIDDLRDHPSHCIGRGFTFDDPDFWANVTLIMAASYYLQVNYYHFNYDFNENLRLT